MDLAQESIKHLTPRPFIIILVKKDKKIDYWPRLSKQKDKLAFLKTDFNRWVDEDEQNDKIGIELVRQVISFVVALSSLMTITYRSGGDRKHAQQTAS